MLTEKMTDDLVKGLREIFGDNLKAIILYGSVARNEATQESDIDVAIITDSDIVKKNKTAFFRWAADMDLRYDRVFSIVDIKEANLKKWGNILPFYKNIQREGVILWKAA